MCHNGEMKCFPMARTYRRGCKWQKVDPGGEGQGGVSHSLVKNTPVSLQLYWI